MSEQKLRVRFGVRHRMFWAPKNAMVGVVYLNDEGFERLQNAIHVINLLTAGKVPFNLFAEVS